MIKQKGKEYVPYIVGVVLFFLITIIYFSPLFQGKVIKQNDNIQFRGMAKEILDYREKTGEEPLWTNSLFSGMPAYQISVVYSNNLIKKIDSLLRAGLPVPADFLFVSMIGFFILLVAFGVNPWIGIIGAIAFSFSSYYFIIFEAGHNTKALAMAYMAPIVAGVYLTYRGRYLIGATLTMLFLALELTANHVQITYYLLFILLFIAIAEFVLHIKERRMKSFFIASGILLFAVFIGSGPAITNLLLTQEYAGYTIRGESELTDNKENKTKGLDRDYATQWSYGKQETFSLMIPNVKGGSTGMIGSTVKDLSSVVPQWRDTVSRQNIYWGDQPFTSGPVYVGCIVCFLFVLGLFIVKNHLKWALFATVILSIFLAWGHNMMWFTDFFLNYVPGYNKFRAVSMTLVIAQFSIPLLASMALYTLYQNRNDLMKYKSSFYWSLGLTAGVCLLFYIFPTLFFNFLSREEYRFFMGQQAEQPQYAAQLQELLANLQSVRVSIFRSDAMRSFLFIAAAAGVLVLLGKKIIKILPAFVLLGVLIFVDLWVVDKRYLNEGNFVSRISLENPFKQTPADKEILKDSDLYYRVFNISVNTFNDVSTSYYHNSIGGYHGAKLRRYQDLIDRYISKNHLPVLNMLNAKYIIVPGDRGIPVAQRNYSALGNAWFVNAIEPVKNADEELEALRDFSPENTAIVDQLFLNDYSGKTSFTKDDVSSIELVSYAPNKLTYRASNINDGFAVFSDIYYPIGWTAYVDGNQMPYVRTNYCLRGMYIPAGEHDIEFVFKPKTYAVGQQISLVSSIFIILMLLLCVGNFLRTLFRNNINKKKINLSL